MDQARRLYVWDGKSMRDISHTIGVSYDRIRAYIETGDPGGDSDAETRELDEDSTVEPLRAREPKRVRKPKTNEPEAEAEPDPEPTETPMSQEPSSTFDDFIADMIAKRKRQQSW